MTDATSTPTHVNANTNTATTTSENHEPDEDISAGSQGPGEYRPAGEAQGEGSTFSADDVAGAFEVAVERVHNAFAGEFGLGTDGRVDSKQAQGLAEVILGDQPLDNQQAALMKLGAFTPRTDHASGSGETPSSEESDRIQPTPDVPHPNTARSGIDETPNKERERE